LAQQARKGRQTLRFGGPAVSPLLGFFPHGAKGLGMGYLIVFAFFSVAAWFAGSMLIYDVLCEAKSESEIFTSGE